MDLENNGYYNYFPRNLKTDSILVQTGILKVPGPVLTLTSQMKRMKIYKCSMFSSIV